MTGAARTPTDVQDPPQSLWGVLKSIGPGLILTANIVGTGELIATTRMGSLVGISLLWFIIFSCVIKVFVQVELGRFAVSEGVGSLEILNRLPGPKVLVRWSVWLWAFMYLGTLCQMAGMVGGIAELVSGKQTGGFSLATSVATSVVCVLMLTLGRYGVVEKLSTWMVVLFSLSSFLAVAFLQSTDLRLTAAELGKGFGLQFPSDLTTVFVVFGITGVGAAELIFYPIWCLEKGYARAVGPRDDSPAWQARARGWLRVMRCDAWLSMGVYTLSTACFYVLGASILHRQGLVVDDAFPMATLSQIYTQTYGVAGKRIFYVGAFMVLFSTYFVSTASNARLFADATALMGVARYKSPAQRSRVVNAGVVGIGVITLVLSLTVGAPVTLVLIGGTAQALMLPFLGFAAVWFHRQISPALRAKFAWTACLVLAFFSMTAVGIFQLQEQLPALMRRMGALIGFGSS